MSAAQIGEPWHDTFAHDFRTLARYDHSVAIPDLGTLFRFAPTTALGRAQQRAAEIYGVPFAYPSTNGTTPPNLLALATIRSPGDTVLIGREAHVSILAPPAAPGRQPRPGGRRETKTVATVRDDLPTGSPIARRRRHPRRAVPHRALVAGMASLIAAEDGCACHNRAPEKTLSNSGPHATHAACSPGGLFMARCLIVGELPCDKLSPAGRLCGA